MQKLTLGMVTEFSQGELFDGKASTPVDGFSIDSRTLKQGNHFVALKGEHADGHRYVEAARKAGAVAAMVSRDRAGEFKAAFPRIAVADPLMGLQLTAARYRKLLPIKTVAITGSNGKTSTKELVASVLSQKYQITKTEGNLNNHIGVPLSLLQLRGGDELGILEIGINHVGEIEPLVEMVRPTAGIITNVGSAHIEFFKDESEIAREKGILAEKVPSNGVVILNRDNMPWSDQIAARTKAKILWFGFDRTADFRAERVMLHERGSDFQLVGPDSRIEINFLWPGQHQIYNALAAAALGSWFGLNLLQIRAGLESAAPPKMRMQMVKVGAGIRVWNDAYNANPQSMQAALAAFQTVKGKGRKIAVLGEMRELGAFSERAHLAVGTGVARAGCDLLVTVGKDGVWMAKGALDAGMGMHQVEQFASSKDAGEWLKENLKSGDSVLLKGSRGNKLETILDFWK
jgi:UDP-N-acetylmuramoyl-tripeptide--D-alanyl-D-alanine ligase